VNSELVDFLRARLDEEEQLRAEARKWSDRDWTVYTGSDGRTTVMSDDTDVIAWIELDGEPGKRIAEQIAHYDPARVRADIEAKRHILAEYEQAADFYTRNVSAPAGEAHGLRTALRYLALPYRDHADYRDEWAPDVE
jgi:hypothetical protein